MTTLDLYPTFKQPIFVEQNFAQGYYNTVRSVRPVIAINSTLRDRTPAAPEVPLQASEKRWGKPSKFQWSVTAIPTTGVSVSVEPGSDPSPDTPDIPDTGGGGGVLIEMQEIQRTVKTITVYNPADQEQYVKVERIENIIFQAPASLANALIGLLSGTVSNLQFKYVLKNKSA